MKGREREEGRKGNKGGKERGRRMDGGREGYAGGGWEGKWR